ncbi:MAG: hypothetical protein BAJALOKI3v1_410014 [Promethearchaeota archaeon]|nr:MAG: hypothetical protein BAJALOKI3v1_410014 [Candidatus Lokiarchaeota archaeon]
MKLTSLRSRIFVGVFGLFWLVAVILLGVWLFNIVFPFIDTASIYQDFYGISIFEGLGGDYVIDALFNNLYFILMVVFGIIGIPFGVVTFIESRKSVNKGELETKGISTEY